MNSARKFKFSGILLICWIVLTLQAHAQECAKNPYSTNYLFLYGSSNEPFLKSVECDLKFWNWNDWQINLGSSYTYPYSIQPKGAELHVNKIYQIEYTEFEEFYNDSTPSVIDSDDNKFRNRFSDKPTQGFGVSASRYYDYEIVVLGYGGVSFDFFNFTLEDKLKLGTWKNSQETFAFDWFWDNQSDRPPTGNHFNTKPTFETETQLSLQLVSLGMNFCAIKMSALGGLYRVSYCYAPSVALASIKEDGVGGDSLSFPFVYDRINFGLGIGLSMDLWMFGGSSLGIGYNNDIYRFPNIPKNRCPSCPKNLYLLTKNFKITLVSREIF